MSMFVRSLVVVGVIWGSIAVGALGASESDPIASASDRGVNREASSNTSGDTSAARVAGCIVPDPIILDQYAIPGSGPGGYVAKGRYITFIAPPLPAGATAFAIRVRLAVMPDSRTECGDLLPDASSVVGDVMWVNSAEVPSGHPSPIGVYGLTNDAMFKDWTDPAEIPPTCVGASGESVSENKFCGSGPSSDFVSEAKCQAAGGSCQSVIAVSDCNILPCAEYEVSVITDACLLSDPLNFSDVVTIPTVPPTLSGRLTDQVGPFNPNPGVWRYSPPDGIADLTDIAACIAAFKSTNKQPPRTFSDLSGRLPLMQTDQGRNHSVDFYDITTFEHGFGGFLYDETPPTGRATLCGAGACCNGSSCSVESWAGDKTALQRCEAAGNTYLGDGVSCDPNPCP